MAARTLSPADDTKYASNLKSAGWIRMAAKFPGRCAKCGDKTEQGTLIVWNKATSKVMHYNGCALDWMDANGSGAASTSAQLPLPTQVSIGAKKAAKNPEKPVETKTETTTKETNNVVAPSPVEQPAPVAQPRKKFGFVSIKPSDLGK